MVCLEQQKLESAVSLESSNAFLWSIKIVITVTAEFSTEQMGNDVNTGRKEVLADPAV